MDNPQSCFSSPKTSHVIHYQIADQGYSLPQFTVGRIYAEEVKELGDLAAILKYLKCYQIERIRSVTNSLTLPFSLCLLYFFFS